VVSEYILLFAGKLEADASLKHPSEVADEL
jgi:hypothetical protein